MDALVGDADFAPVGAVLSGWLLDGEQLQAFEVGVSDSEPWRRIGVAVTNRRVLWIDASTANVISVTYDAVMHMAFLVFDAPPRPIYFDVEIHNDTGVVSIWQDASTQRQAVGSARSALVHEWIDTVRFTASDAQRLRRVLLGQAPDDGEALPPGPGDSVLGSWPRQKPTHVDVGPWCGGGATGAKRTAWPAASRVASRAKPPPPRMAPSP